MKNYWLIVVAIVVLAVGAYVLIDTVPSGMGSTASTTASGGTNNPVTFYCQQGTITASFTNATVALALSDGRSFSLPQTISASGIRYEATTTGKDELFESKGSSAMLSENGTDIYSNCIAAHITDAGGGYHTFLDQSGTFSFVYPDSFVVTGTEPGYTNDWMVNSTTLGLLLATIDLPKTAEPGTNFGDAKLTVGTSADPAAVSSCLTFNPTGGPKVAPTTATINGLTFAQVSSADAGAGNRYDTTSYRIVRDNQCYAIEYTIHYGNIDNYPAGSVKVFNEAAVKSELDAIVASFKFLQ